MTVDWQRWHEEYDIPGSSLSRRRAVVRDLLREVLPGCRTLISMCAGDGGDVLPVLPPGVRALLVELDPVLAGRARAAAPAGVTVLTGDAGVIDPYLDFAPADVVLACGVFGNVPVADAHRTIAALPGLTAEGGSVIWTRGHAGDGPDPSDDLRECFAAHGFTETAFVRPPDAKFRVGLHRLDRRGTRLFSFLRPDTGRTDDRPGPA